MKPIRATFAGAVILTAVAATSLADPPEVFSFSGVNSDGLLGAAANQVRAAAVVGGYPLRRVTASGSLLSLLPTTWRTDSRILITAPDGQTVTCQPFRTGSTFTLLSFSVAVTPPSVTDPAGSWSFRFYEAINDGASNQPDARWNITFTFSDQLPPPPTATDLSQVFAPGATQQVGVGPNSVQWFTFVVPRLVSGVRGTFLDIDTAGSVIEAVQGSGTFPNDTEIGLYDSQGRLVASDDDDGVEYTSALSFGEGGRPGNAEGRPFDGRHGPLPAGRYYLAVGVHNLAFEPLWTVVGNGTQTGVARINIRTNIAPSPVCAADFNGDGFANSQDFFDFLGAFFGLDPGADVNLDGFINSQDFFDFLGSFFTGC